MNFSWSMRSAFKKLNILNTEHYLMIITNDNSFHVRNIFMSALNAQHKLETHSKVNIFDRQAKIYQRERASLSENADFHSFLKDEIGYRLADRIYDIKRTFPKVLNLGCGKSHVSKHVVKDWVEELVMCDSSEILLSQAACEDPAVKISKVTCDEENLLTVFKPDTFNMVISNLTLHWVNDLPKCFSDVITVLKNDGAFLGSLFGGDTLFELRSSLQLAESERKGGISPHISPFARPRDVGSLLTQAGFVMQTIDTDEEILKYANMFELLDELKGMGENNAAWNRCLHIPRDTLIAASAIYDQLYGKMRIHFTNTKIQFKRTRTTVQKSQADSSDNIDKTEERADDELHFKGINATFQIIYFIGWKPDPSQPQPLPRGSADVSLKDFYNLRDVLTKGKTKINLDEE